MVKTSYLFCRLVILSMQLLQAIGTKESSNGTGIQRLSSDCLDRGTTCFTFLTASRDSARFNNQIT